MKQYREIFLFALFIMLGTRLPCAGQTPDERASSRKNRIIAAQQVSAEHAQNETKPAAQDTKVKNKSASNGGEFEQRYPSKYRVRKGETLADIAGRREIFNDPFLWPLIYKANRDQIRDPQVIFPGQQLTIPRDVTREDIIEARKDAGALPAYIPPRDAYGPDVYRRFFPAGADRSNAPADNESKKRRDAGP